MVRKTDYKRILLIGVILAVLVGALVYVTTAQQAQIPPGHSEDDGHNHG